MAAWVQRAFPVRRNFLRQLVLGAREVGWRNAVKDLLAERHPSLFQYVADERAGDWRFLLPTLPGGSALCAGGALAPVPFSLAESCKRVVVCAPRGEATFLKARARDEKVSNIEAACYPVGHLVEQFDLVAGLRRAPGFTGRCWSLSRLNELTDRVKAGGHLYLEIEQPALRLPPSLLRARLASLGFSEVQVYWPKPTFSTCEMLIPMGDRRVQDYYLDNVFFAMSSRRRLLKSLLRVAARLGLFELTLPGYIAIARRHGEGQSQP